MKVIISLVLFLLSHSCFAQSADELIDAIRPKEYHTLVMSSKNRHALDFIPDSLKPLNVKYFNTYNRSTANGIYLVFESLRYDYFINAGVSHCYMPQLGSKPRGMTYIAYFDDGVPDKTWNYVYDRYSSDSLSTIICKRETFNKGLLDGEFIFYSSTDTLYRTMFVNGTGHYRDYFNDGRLMFEGDLIHGYRNGIWSYYQYDNDSTNTPYKVHIECYKSGELEYRELFYPDSRVYNIIEWERSVANRKKHPRKKNEVMINPYIYNRP